MSRNFLVPLLLCDFYKLSHRETYPNKTEILYDTFTPRSNKYFPVTNKVVAFGYQGFVKQYLIELFNENFFNRPKQEVLDEYERFIKFTLGVQNPDSSHIADLHDLGYLPIKISAIKEGTLVPIKVPVLTVENTNKKFFWLTNYLETLISNEIWQPMTSATIAYQYRKLFDQYALKTTGSTNGVEFQGHDFSMRGMSSLQTSMTSGAAHLLPFTGTDTIPAILYLEKYYNANIEKELVGTSIPATEHSVMSANTSADGNRDEYETFKHIITKVYPSGFVSIVSDTYDFWKVITETIPALKNEILNRDGRVVIRPDSGDPVAILCGSNIPDLTNEEYIDSLEVAKEYFYDGLIEKLREETPHGECGDSEISGTFKYQNKYYELKISIFWNRYDKQYYFIDDHNQKSFNEFTPTVQDLGLIEALWNIFGGTITEQGYKILDSHIGTIYGDSITLERAKRICEQLEAKGFASTNVVYGIGSYTYQMNSRDTLGFAMKATYAEIDGQQRMLFKDPKTDDGTKRSQRGRVIVYEKDGEIVFEDGFTIDTFPTDKQNLLEVIFEDGQLKRDQSLREIRSILLK